MNLMKKLLVLSILTISICVSILPFSLVSAQEIPVLEMFHGRECPHCQKQMKWLPTLEKMYPGIEIKKYEVWHEPANQALLEARLAKLGQKFSGVPTNIIKGEVIVGFQSERILEEMEKNFGPPKKIEILDSDKNSYWIWGAVLVAILGGGILFYKKKNA